MADRSLYCKNTILGFLRKREPLFGGWRVVAFLGSGAFGCVFKLEREDLGAKFVSALKVIALSKKVGGAGDSLDSLQDAISQEAKELVHLYSLGGHQNVVGWHNHQVFHIRDSESVTALIAVMMDYLPNNLGREIRKGPVPWPKAMRILADCLRGLAHIHVKQVIHRDIKPENIFINDDGMARIGDFGVARQVTDTNQAETRVGTPLYIAPEVIRDPYGHGYDYQVDIYSLGLVGYEMLVGTLPFYEESKGNKNLMVKKRLSGGIITLPDTLPRGVRDVILGAVQYDPDRRYSSAAEFLEAVDRVLSTEGLDTVRPLPIVRVMPSSTESGAPSWTQVDVAPPASPSALPPGAPRQDDLPPALASVIQSAAVTPPPASEPSGFPLRNGAAVRPAPQPVDDEHFEPPFPRAPQHVPSRPTQPAYTPYAHKEQSIFGMDDPYTTRGKRAGVNSWEVAATVAGLGCVLSVYFRQEDAFASMVFLLCYVLGALYFILAVRQGRTLAALSFAVSLMVGNYLKYGSLETILSSMDYALLGLYAVIYLVAPKVNAYLGRS